MSNSHRNKERTVRCPVEGCDAEKLARGIHLHIRQSSGNGHGPTGEVPDHIDLDNLETVGSREVEMNYPSERETQDAARLCPYCSKVFKGKRGVLIHLGQKAGQKNHPVETDKLSGEEAPRVEVDRHGDTTSFVDDLGDIRRTGVETDDKESRHQLYDLMEEVRRWNRCQ